MKNISIKNNKGKRDEILDKYTAPQSHRNRTVTEESSTQKQLDLNTHIIKEQNNKNYKKIERTTNSKTDSSYGIENKNINLDNDNNQSENLQTTFNIKEITLSIFLNYSKFSKEEFQFLLHYQSLIKILKSARIMDEFNNVNTLLKTQEFDLLYKKVNQNSKNLNINQFNNFLVLLTNKLFKKEFEADPKLSISNFIMEFLGPLNEIIQQEVLDNPESEVYIHQATLNKFSEIQFDNQIIYIVNSILPGLRTLYINFFELEVSKIKDVEKIYKDSLNQMIKFCQIYEIMPFIISLDKLAIYFNLVNRMNIEDITNNAEIKLIIERQKELGTLFTLSKFISLLYHFSVLSFDKYSSYLKNSEQSSRLYSQLGLKTETLGNSEKFILFLERIQSLEFKMNAQGRSYFRDPNQVKFDIIPAKEIINAINPELINEKLEKASLVRSASKLDHEIIKNIELKSLNHENIDIRTMFNFESEELYLKLNHNLESLKDIFESYAMIGDKTDITNLSLSGYIKLLNDCELIYENQNAFIKKELIRVKSDQNFNQGNLLRDFHDHKNNLPNVKSNANFLQNIPKGKISKNDICIVFYYVCGLRKAENPIHNVSLNTRKSFNDVHEQQFSQRSADFTERSYLKSNREVQLSKMSFPIFLKSFEFLAKKINPNLDVEKAFERFLDVDLANILKTKSETITLKKNLVDNLLNLRGDEIIDLLRNLVNLIYPHYANYADSNELLDYSGVFNFYKDFEIFPDLINLIQLKTIYSSLHEILSEKLLNEENEIDARLIKEIKDNNKINFNSFMDTLLLTSIHIRNEEDITSIERILYLVQRMANSKGVAKSCSKSGKFSSSFTDLKLAVKELKEKYGLVKDESMKNILRSLSCFEDIFKEQA